MANEVTQEEIDKAVEKCYWKSQNRPGNLMPDICTGMCLPCAAVINSGKCDTLIELFDERISRR